MAGLGRADIDRLNQLISHAANQHVRSPIAVETENVSIDGERSIIVLTVPEGIDKPYFDHHGVIWLKSGADKRRINSKETLRRLFQEVDVLHADEIPTQASIDALNQELMESFLGKTYGEKWTSDSVEQQRLLENLNLSKGDRLNLAGLLLFGKKPHLFKPAFVIKAVNFYSTDMMSSYVDSEDFEGPLTTLFRGALAFILRHLYKLQNGKSVNSVGDPEIPPVVFEELLVNALIHRDYFLNAPIKLFVFTDRIEIISPGHLPNHLTVEKIRNGNSVLRNPILASFAAKGLLPYRGLGTGVRRALESWPKIQFIDDRDGATFRIVIARVPVYPVLGSRTLQEVPGDPKNDPKKDFQTELVELIRGIPTASYEELAERLGKDRSTIKRHIQRLKAHGLIRRIGSKKKGAWEIYGVI